MHASSNVLINGEQTITIAPEYLQEQKNGWRLLVISFIIEFICLLIEKIKLSLSIDIDLTQK